MHSSPQKGDLRIWWVPQVPGKPFYVKVKNLREARLLTETLALYDLFQFKNKIKPDYCNAGGLQVFEPELTFPAEGQDGWVDWHSEDGEEFESYCEQHPEDVA